MIYVLFIVAVINGKVLASSIVAPDHASCEATLIELQEKIAGDEKTKLLGGACVKLIPVVHA